MGAINECAVAIHNIHVHACHIQRHALRAKRYSDRMQEKSGVLVGGVLKLNRTLARKSDRIVKKIEEVSREASRQMSRASSKLESLDFKEVVEEVRRNIILVIVPIMILVLEVIVSVAYLSIILATVPSVDLNIKSQLIVGAEMAA